jgi:flavin-dependent dehydrogenase
MQWRSSPYDCVVIGAGPAGCTAAALVAERGHATLLLERERMPRFHVGESLMPDTFWTLQRLGILDQLHAAGFVQKVGVQFVSPSGTESQPFYFAEHDPRMCSRTWHVERAAFDQLLFDNAARKGATCVDQTKVVDVRVQPASPHELMLKTADGPQVSIRARVVVDATGQQALLANRLGLRVMNPDLKKVAIWGHYRNARRTAPDTEEITTILHTAGKLAWFWYIPLSGNKVSIGLVGDAAYLLKQDKQPEAVFAAYAEACPALRDRLTDAELVAPLQVVREFSYTTRQHAGDGWVLVGDAFGFIDPV